MGIYNGAVITSTGQALLAQSVAGSELKFTTIKTSNYVYPAGTSLADLTTLTGIKQSKNVTGATVYNSRVIKVSAMVDNAGVTAEYSINTIGVYATIGTAAEQLFAVITAQEADKMPAFNSRPYSYIYDLNMTMQGASNITVTVNNAGFVNINDLNNALEGINESIESINEDLSTLSEDKVNVSDIVNNLTSSDADKPLSAAMGAELNKKFNNMETLPITRTEQEYVSVVSLGRCNAFKRNGYLFFKGNIEMSYGSGFSDFTEIGKISGWRAVDAVYINVPSQSGGGVVASFAISADGQIRTYSSTAFSNVPFFRFEAVVPTSNS